MPVSHHRGEFLLLGAISPGVHSSPDYYVNVDGEADWNLADVNPSDEPLDHTVLRTKLSELQDACRRVDLVVP